jgi:hypothetical protein
MSTRSAEQDDTFSSKKRAPQSQVRCVSAFGYLQVDVPLLQVYYTQETVSLQDHGGRLRFARILYNLADSLRMEESDSNFQRTNEVYDALAALKKHANGPTFISTKHQRNTGQEGDSPDAESKRQRQREEGIDTLKRAGYELVPDVIENDNGTFELGYKVCAGAICDNERLLVTLCSCHLIYITFIKPET